MSAVDFDALVSALSGDDRAARAAALNAVLAIRPDPTQQARHLMKLHEALLRLVTLKDEETVYLARKGIDHVAGVLRDIGGPQLASSVPGVAPDALPSTKAELLAALKREKDPAMVANLTARLGKHAGEDVLEAAIGLTKHADARVRSNAVEVVMAGSQARRLLVTLVPLLADSNHRVRATVARALSRLGYPMVAGILAEMLSSPETRFRESALWVAGHVDRKENVALLLRALDDPFLPIRLRAIRGLANHRAQAAVPRLEAMAAHPDAHVREEVAHALAAIRGAEPAPEKLVDLGHLAEQSPDTGDPE